MISGKSRILKNHVAINKNIIGWIKLHRQLITSDLWKNLNSKQRDVFINCLILANHADNNWEWGSNIYKCKAGQFITSLEKLKRKCSSEVKIQSVRSALIKFEKWHFLTNESTKTGRLITILNWAKYQHDDCDTNKEPNKELTKSQQRANKELTTNKNDKNEKNEKKRTMEKKKFLDYVFLSENEEIKLLEKFGFIKFNACVEKLDNFIPNSDKGRKYNDHYRVLLGWVNDWYDKENKSESNITPIVPNC